MSEIFYHGENTKDFLNKSDILTASVEFQMTGKIQMDIIIDLCIGNDGFILNRRVCRGRRREKLYIRLKHFEVMNNLEIMQAIPFLDRHALISV